MSLEPSWNLEDDFPDLTAKVRVLVDKALKKIKDSDSDKLNQENIENPPNAFKDLEFRKNILKRVRQRLEEEKPSYSAVQDEVQEIGNMLNAVQKRTDHVIEDLKFIKMLVLEAHDRLTDDSESTEQKGPSSPLQSPKILEELGSGFQK